MNPSVLEPDDIKMNRLRFILMSESPPKNALGAGFRHF